MRNLLFFIFIIFLFYIGYSYGGLIMEINFNYDYFNYSSNLVFRKILIQNSIVALLIILGITTHNIFSICLVGVNFFHIGFQFKSFVMSIGIVKSILLFLPHGMIEILWLILIPLKLFDFFGSYRKLLDTEFSDSEFFAKIFNYKFLFVVLLVPLSAFIEAYITPYLFELYI